MNILFCISIVLIWLIIVVGNELQRNNVDSNNNMHESRSGANKSKNELEMLYLSLFESYEEIEVSLISKTAETANAVNVRIEDEIKNIESIENSLDSDSSSAATNIRILAKKINRLTEISKKGGLELFNKSSKSMQHQFILLSDQFFESEFSDQINDSFSRNDIKINEKLGIK